MVVMNETTAILSFLERIALGDFRAVICQSCVMMCVNHVDA